MMQSLELLSRWLSPAEQTRGQERDGSQFRHLLSQSWIGPFSDRERYAGDPDYVDVHLNELLDTARLDARAARLDRSHAQPIDAWAMPLDDSPPPNATPGDDHGTTHLCVVDREGNVAALTSTVNLPFGAQFTANGIVMNDEMDDFGREVGAANAFGLAGGAANLPGPGRRPVSTMSPTIVFEGNRPVLCVGGSGGSRIVTAAEQVALFQLLLGDSAAQAMARPRIHHQGRPAQLSFERRLSPSLIMGLLARGHTLSAVEASANVQTIRIHWNDDGTVRVLDAASDFRKNAEPRGR